MRLEALAEIYTMHSFAPFSKLTFLFKNHLKIAFFLPNVAKIVKNSLEFVDSRADFCRNFTK